MYANPYRVAQVWTRHVMMRSLSYLLAVLPYLANEGDSAPRIVECDVVADLPSKSISACGVKCARIHFARYSKSPLITTIVIYHKLILHSAIEDLLTARLA